MSTPPNPRTTHRFRYWIILAVSTMALLAGGLAAWKLQSAQEERLRKEFDTGVRARLAAIDLRLQSYTYALEDLRALFLASPQISDRDFVLFSAPFQQRFPEVAFISFSTPDAQDVLRISQLSPADTKEVQLGDALSRIVPEMPRGSWVDPRQRYLRLYGHVDDTQHLWIDMLLPVVHSGVAAGATHFQGILHLRFAFTPFVSSAYSTMEPAGIDTVVESTKQNRRKILHYQHSRLNHSPYTDEELQHREHLTFVHAEYSLLAGGLDWQLIFLPIRNTYQPDYFATFLLLATTLSLVLAYVIFSLRLLRKREQMKNELTLARNELKYCSAQLQHTVQELDGFSYSVAHDLRAPLRHIRSYAQLLLSEHGTSLSSDGRLLTERMSASAAKMARLIEDLLKLSRVGRTELHIETLNLSSLVSSCYIEQRAEFPKLEVRFKCAPELIIKGDQSLLRIALSNLLNNALKYSSERILVDIHFGADVSPDGEVVYFLRDNGCGFEMEYAERLFTPFNRLHAEDHYGGTGVGLAIVRRVFAHHGGRIWVKSEVNKGSTFYFTLPNMTTVLPPNKAPEAL